MRVPYSIEHHGTSVVNVFKLGVTVPFNEQESSLNDVPNISKKYVWFGACSNT